MIPEHLNIQVKSLCPLLGGEWLWDGLLSQCFLFGALRHAFNPILTGSGSGVSVTGEEDKNVQYVNSPKFVFCVAIELFNYHYLKPYGLFIEVLNHICSRQ